MVAGSDVADTSIRWSSFTDPPTPSGRSGHTLINAPEIGKLILYGGIPHFDDGDMTATTGEIWLLDLASDLWTRVPVPGPQPPWRAFHSAVWDGPNRRMVVFGGAARGRYRDVVDPAWTFGRLFFNDLWSLEFDASGIPSGWKQLHPGGALEEGAREGLDFPTKRALHAAVFDPVRQRMIVYGGTDTPRMVVGGAGDLVEHHHGWATGRKFTTRGLGDVWSFDLSGSAGWVRLSEDGPPRFDAQAVFDPPGDRLVVQGGVSGNKAQSDYLTGELKIHDESYAFDLVRNVWTQLTAAGEGPELAGAAHGYSLELQGMIVRNWSYPGKKVSDDPSAFACPQPLHLLRLGAPGDAPEWVDLPSQEGQHCLTYSPVGLVIGQPERFVVYGDIFLDQFAWDEYDIGRRRWTIPLTGTRMLRASPAVVAAHDTSNDAMFVVGGGELFQGRAGTWSQGSVWRLDLKTRIWQEVQAPEAVSPARRYYPDGKTGEEFFYAVFDPVNERIVLGDYCLEDLWSIDVSDGTLNWSRIHPSGEPPFVCGGAAVYDSVRERIVIVGGRLARGCCEPPNRKPFALELEGGGAHWRELEASGEPQSLTHQWVWYRSTYAVYDAASDRIVTISADGESVNEPPTRMLVQTLDFASGPDGSWNVPAVGGEPPSVRGGSNVVLDAARHRILMIGGGPWSAEGSPPLGQVYALTMGPDLSWQELAVGNPLAFGWGSAIVDDDQVVLFGGDVTYESGLSRETYALSLASPSASGAESSGSGEHTLGDRSVTLNEIARVGSGLQVSGHATFVDQPFEELGTDPVGDPGEGGLGIAGRGLGTDVTAISAAGALAGDLLLRWTVSELPPEQDGTPGVVYSARFCIDWKAGDQCWELVAHRARVSPVSLEPVGTLHRCVPPGQARNCGGSAAIAATDVPVALDRTARTITATLDPTDVPASAGSMIEWIEPGVTPAVSTEILDHPGVRVDRVGDAGDLKSYRLPVKEVELTIAERGLSPESIEYSTTTDPSTDGGFAASLDTSGLSGPYQVYARACFGAGNCAYATKNIDIT